MSANQGIIRAAAIITAGSILSRLLGLVREQLIAGLFGATGATDAFVIASTVPTLVYDLTVGGAITAAIVPVMSEYLARGDEGSFWRVASSLISLVAVLLTIVSASLIFLAPQLSYVLSTGFAANLQSTTVGLIRLVIPSVILFGLSGIATGLLYARQSFALPSFSPVLYNIGLLLVIALITITVGPRLESLVLGILVGASLQVVLQLPWLKGLKLSLNWREPGLKRIVQLYTPVALGLVVSVAGVILDRNLASRTGEGNIAVMRFATFLVQLPLGIISSAVSLAVLPALSRYAANSFGSNRPFGLTPPSVTIDYYSVDSKQPLPGNWQTTDMERVQDPSTVEDPFKHYKETLEAGIRLALTAVLPAMVGLVILRQPIIQLLFERGAFDPSATTRTALAFLFYAPQLPFVTIDLLLVYAFYARKDTLTPALVGILGLLTYAVVGLSLMGTLGFIGLIMANTTQHTVHATILFALTQRAMGSVLTLPSTKAIAKIALASLLMASVLYLVEALALGRLESRGPLGLLIYLGLASGVGMLTYALCIYWLKLEEARLLGNLLARKLHLS